jgi:hypothetical protein
MEAKTYARRISVWLEHFYSQIVVTHCTVDPSLSIWYNIIPVGKIILAVNLKFIVEDCVPCYSVPPLKKNISVYNHFRVLPIWGLDSYSKPNQA